MDLAEFRRAYLCQWPEVAKPGWDVIGQDAWGACADPGGAAVSGEVAFGCQISEDCTCHPQGRKHAAIVAAGRGAAGPGGRSTWCGTTTRGARWPGWRSCAEKHDPVAVVVDPRSQSGTLLQPLAEAGVLVTAADGAGGRGGPRGVPGPGE